MGWSWNSFVGGMGAVGTAIGHGLLRGVDIGRKLIGKASPMIEILRGASRHLSHVPIPVVRDAAFAAEIGLGLADAAIGRLNPLLDAVESVGNVMVDIHSPEAAANVT